jgi:hypothetical protein
LLGLISIGGGEGVVAAGNSHFLVEHPVLVLAGGGVHLGATDGAAHEGPAALSREIGEAFFEGRIAEFGPGVEVAKAVSDVDESAREFLAGGGGIELFGAGPQAIAGDEDGFGERHGAGFGGI